MAENMPRAVQLIGGRFNGSIVTPSETAVTHGCLIMCECPRHGVNPAQCECDDAVLYGYYADHGLGSGQYVPVGDG